MKRKLTLISFLLVVFNGNAQIADSTSLVKSQSKLSYKQFIVPTVLIGGGFLLKESTLNKNLQKDAQKIFGSDFQTQIDNVIPFIPIAQIYGGMFHRFDYCVGYYIRNEYINGLMLPVRFGHKA